MANGDASVVVEEQRGVVHGGKAVAGGMHGLDVYVRVGIGKYA